MTERSATSLAREASCRDVVVRITDAASDTSVPASEPDLNIVRIDAGAVGLRFPDRVVLVDSLISRLQAPLVAGTVLAGAARAAHSRWVSRVPQGTNPDLIAMAWRLDQARAKKRLIMRRPQDRLFLRVAAVAEHGVGTTSRVPPGDVTLRSLLDVLPEAECGVLPRWLGVEVRRHLEEILGEELMTRTSEIWREVQLVADDNEAAMLALAERWLELFPPDIGDGPNVDSMAMGSDTLAEMLTQVSDETTAEATADLATLAGHARSPEERAAEAEAAHTCTAAGYAFGASSRKPIKHRAPTAVDITARSVIVRRLRRAQYRAPHKAGVPVGYPTGRARGDSLVQRAAQQAQGVSVTALPWKQRRWRTTPRPPILAGIVVDLSGSMTAWLPAAGTAMWAVAAAVSELGGRAAAAGFAGDVFPLLRPGAQPSRVPLLSSRGGSDRCADAMAAVTGGAQLTRPGAAVMVVLTDSDLPENDREAIDRHARYLERHSVQLIWALTGTRTASSVVPEIAMVLENVTPATFPTLVAGAIADALACPPTR